METFKIKVYKLALRAVCETLYESRVRDIEIRNSSDRDYFIIQWYDDESSFMERLKGKDIADIMGLTVGNKLDSYINDSKMASFGKELKREENFLDENRRKHKSGESLFDTLKGSKA